MSTAIPAIQQAVSESKTEATKTDAQSYGKASRDIGDYTKNNNVNRGITYGTEQAEASHKGRANSVIEESDERALSEKINGRGLSQKNGRDDKEIGREALAGGERREIDLGRIFFEIGQD